MSPEGEELGAAPRAEVKKPAEPYVVPTAGPFYMHDDRFGGEEPKRCGAPSLTSFIDTILGQLLKRAHKTPLVVEKSSGRHSSQRDAFIILC